LRFIRIFGSLTPHYVTSPGVNIRRLIAIAIFLTISTGAIIADAATFDPAAKWQTIDTKHFRVRHPKKLEAQAKKTSRILEEIHPAIIKQWGWKPWSYTEVVIVDNTEQANGMASILPYNWMLINAVPPRPDSSLAHNSDWLRTLLAHEYTHIIQLDAVGGFWRPFKVLIGKTISPSGIDPKWMKEGFAQYDETIYTKGGRGRGSYSEMVIRVAVLTESFPPIDVADGMGWRWPGYNAPYVYGVKFVQWLVEEYGSDRLHEFDKRVRRSPLIGMVNHQARRVYGKTFYELWDEWHQSLINRYADELTELRAEGVSKPEVIIEQKNDEQYWFPTLSPDGKRLAYKVKTPHGPSHIRMLDMESGKTFVLVKKTKTDQISWSPDGNKIIYSKMGGYKTYNRYFDLWTYDFEKKGKRTKKLTVGKRARGADYFPSGNSIVYVTGGVMSDELKRKDLTTGKVTSLTPSESSYTQFANPRVSPDGRYVAVSVWKTGEGWRVYRFDADGNNPKRMTRDKGVEIESHPTWSRDGKYIIFSSDESGIANLYRVKHDGGKAVPVTNLVTGAFQPTATIDGGVIAQGFNEHGFQIVKFGALSPKVVKNISVGSVDAMKSPFAKKESRANLLKAAQAGDTGADGKTKPIEFVSEESLKAKKYVSFGQSLFLPRYILPGLIYADEAWFLSAFTGGNDVLRWQNWTAGVTYRTDAQHLGYTLGYSYNRFKPTFGVIYRDYVANLGTFNTGTRYFELRRGAAAYIAMPIWKLGTSLAYYYEDHSPKTAVTPGQRAVLQLGKFAGLRFRVRYNDAKKYAASISKQEGRIVSLTTVVANSVFGSGEQNEQVIFSGDWREYIDSFGDQVLALRAGGGMTWGDEPAQGTFGLGGAVGEGAFASGGSYSYFPLRGLPVSALSRNRVMLFAGEYRIPIISPQRGIGTMPFFLKDLSGAVFADYGNAWNAHQGGSDNIKTFFDDFMLGVGAELRANFIVGHGLPIHGRLGYAIIVVNRDRIRRLRDPLLNTSIENGMLVLSLGSSF
jgi:Tol biopolymer transport system component